MISARIISCTSVPAGVTVVRNGSVFATGVWSDRPVVTPSASNIAPASPQVSNSWLVTLANDGSLVRNVQNTLTLVASDMVALFTALSNVWYVKHIIIIIYPHGDNVFGYAIFLLALLSYAICSLAVSFSLA
jgi:hypothetical protein